MMSARPLAGVGAVFRHEWRQLVHAPLTYVFQSGFLLALNAAIFLVADFYSTDVASLELAWTFLPWIALILVPALAMRAFVDEPGDRALELTLTLPIPIASVVVGKWLAGTLLLLVTLAFMAPFAATVAYLGTPDWGAAAAGALAAGLLLATCYAVALLAAATVRDPISAYVLGLGALLLLLMLGWDVVPRLARGLPGGAIVDAMAMASPKHWLDRMATGRIELGALAYFAVAPLLALAGAAHVIAGRGTGGRGRVRSLIIATGSLLIGASVVAAAARIPLAIDATAAREHSLHQETIAAARALPPGTELRLYWSASEASVPQSIRAHARRARDLLAAIARRSDGRITLSEHDATPDSDAEAEALAAGLARVPMTSGDSFVLGVTLQQGDRRLAIPYLDIRRAGHLEYDVALALANLARTRPLKLGVLTPLLTPRNASEPREGLAFLEELKRAYDVAIIPHFADALPTDLDALLVINAPILKPSMLYAIDQHVMAGKGLVAMLDPYVRFDRAQNVAVSQPSPEVDDISDLLDRYGLTFAGERVVGDANLAAPVRQGAQKLIAYPYWLKIHGDGIARDQSVTAELNELLFAEPGAITIADPAKAVALVTTSDRTGSIPRTEVETGTPETLSASFKADAGRKVIAAATTAPLASAFPSPPASDTTGEANRQPHRSTSVGAPRVFAVADVDWLFDPFSLQQGEQGGKIYARPLNDNIALLLNMVETATGDPRLLAIRSRGQLERPFTRVAELMREARATYQTRESELVMAIGKAEASINEVLAMSKANSERELPQELRSQIGELKMRLLPFRKELRELRLQMRRRAINLGRWLTIINLVAGPLLVVSFLALVSLARRRRQRRPEPTLRGSAA